MASAYHLCIHGFYLEKEFKSFRFGFHQTFIWCLPGKQRRDHDCPSLKSNSQSSNQNWCAPDRLSHPELRHPCHCSKHFNTTPTSTIPKTYKPLPKHFDSSETLSLSLCDRLVLHRQNSSAAVKPPAPTRLRWQHARAGSNTFRACTQPSWLTSQQPTNWR